MENNLKKNKPILFLNFKILFDLGQGEGYFSLKLIIMVIYQDPRSVWTGSGQTACGGWVGVEPILVLALAEQTF